MTLLEDGRSEGWVIYYPHTMKVKLEQGTSDKAFISANLTHQT